MNLRQLNIFFVVSETGSMSEAARKLYMTQPAVSQTISELEEELQIKLFERIHKRLVQTYPGEILYNYARKILLMVDEAEKTIKDIASMKMGKLRLGASTTIGIYLLPKIVSDYNRKYENIKMYFSIDNTSIIEEMILNHQIDIGLVEGFAHSDDIEIKQFFKDEIYFICSNNHRWIKEKRFVIDPEEIAKETLIIREQGSGTREIVEEVLKTNNISYTFTHVLNNTEAIKKAVQENIGVSFVSKMSVHEEIVNGRLKKVDLGNIHFYRKLNIIYHKEKFQSPLFDSFIKHLDLYKNI